MKPRLNPYQAAPEAMKVLVALENYVQQSGLDHSLIDLVKTRASRINGCVLHPYAYGGDARSRRDRGAPLFAGRMT
jgi:alkylhydroperoxidase family enzyme